MSKWARFLDPPTVVGFAVVDFSRGGRATETVDLSSADIRIDNVMKVSANFQTLYIGRGIERGRECVYIDRSFRVRNTIES